MKNTLITHHLSSYWNEGMKTLGTNYSDVLEKVIDFIKNKDIDNVIVPLFEEYEPNEDHYKLIKTCENNGIKITFLEYGYGWRRDEEHLIDQYPLEKLNDTWTYGTREYHTEEDIIPLEDWQKKLKNDNVYISGAFQNECVLDLTTALDALDIPYHQVDGLVVGDFLEYEFLGIREQDIIHDFQNKINDIDYKIEERCDELEISNELEELIQQDPNFVLNISNEIKEIFSDLEEYLDDYDLNAYSSYQIITDEIDYFLENHEILDDISLMAKQKIKQNLFTKDYKKNTEQYFYHGTTWQFDDNSIDIHTELNRINSATGAVFVSNKESVAEWFKSWCMSEDEKGIPVIFKIKLKLNKVIEFDSEKEDDRNIIINGIEYDIVSDREDMYLDLDGEYDAINIKHNYQEQDRGDDIALLFDIEKEQIESIKVLKNNNKWTEYLSVDEAKKVAIKEFKKIKNIKVKPY